MSNNFQIEEQIELTQTKLNKIKDKFFQGVLSKENQKEAIEGFSITLEELYVALEELKVQNSELLTTRQALEQERQRYCNLFELAPECYIVTNLKGTICQVNKATEFLLKVRGDRLTNKPLISCMAQSSYRAFHTILEQVVDSGRTIKNYQINMKSRQGENLTVLLSVSRELDIEGNEVRLLWSIRDISDRIAAEEKIRQQAALLEVTTDAIMVVDLEDKITYWNNSARNLYGWRKVETLGKDFTTLGWEDETIPEIAEGKKIVSETGQWQQEFKKLTKTGEELLIQSRWFLIRDRYNSPTGILIVDTDITEKKLLESQLLRAQRLETLGTLAGGIAHNLNNILNPILGAAQIIPRFHPDQNEDSRELIAMIEKNARLGANIVKQIVSYAGGDLDEGQNIDLGYLIDEVKSLTSMSFSKQIEIHTSVASDLWQVHADASQIHQVLMNLAINARDAMKQTGTLLICAENCYIDENYAKRHLDARVGNYVMITVSDTGCGIPPEIMERIYEPFFTTKKPNKGTGLGLFTVIGIVKNHGGFIDVSSQVDKGTQFQIFFPAVTETKTQLVELETEIPQGNGEVILIVDDEEDKLSMLQVLLESSGYRVLTANDGEDAIALHQKHRDEIDLILMDWIMPNMNGSDAIARILENNPQAKIIVNSGLAEQETIEEIPQLKATITKPIIIETFLETINRVLKNC